MQAALASPPTPDGQKIFMQMRERGARRRAAKECEMNCPWFRWGRKLEHSGGQFSSGSLRAINVVFNWEVVCFLVLLIFLFGAGCIWFDGIDVGRNFCLCWYLIFIAHSSCVLWSFWCSDGVWLATLSSSLSRLIATTTATTNRNNQQPSPKHLSTTTANAKSDHYHHKHPPLQHIH